MEKLQSILRKKQTLDYTVKTPFKSLGYTPIVRQQACNRAWSTLTSYPENRSTPGVGSTSSGFFEEISGKLSLKVWTHDS